MITFFKKYDNIIIGDSVKKDNEMKMREILDDLEDEIDVKLQDVKDEIVEDDEDIIEEVDSEFGVDDETADSDLEDEESEEDEDLEEEIDDEDDFLEEEETELEEILDEEDEDDDKEKKSVAKAVATDSDIKKIGDYLIEKLLSYKYVILLDFSIFLLLFFLIPTIILEVTPYIWMTLFLVFTILPTMAFYMKKKFKDRQIMLGLVFFYICILLVLDHCTIKDLYGITSHGNLDYSPAFMDAAFVTFIIVFFQYLGTTIVNVMKKTRKSKTKK